MAGPITWRNVSGGDLSAALSALRGTQANMGNMFSGLQETLKNYQEGRSQSAQDEFLNALYGQYRSPEELDAAIQSGAINNLVGQHGSFLDRGAAHLAARDYLDTLRKSAVTGMQHADEVAMRDQRGAYNQAYLASTRGNYGEVDNFFSQHPDAVRGEALIKAMHAALMDNNSDSRASAQHRMNMASTEQLMKYRAAQEARNREKYLYDMGRTKLTDSRIDEDYDRKMGELAEAERLTRAEQGLKRSLDAIDNSDLTPAQQNEASRQVIQDITNFYNLSSDQVQPWVDEHRENLPVSSQLYGAAARQQAARSLQDQGLLQYAEDTGQLSAFSTNPVNNERQVRSFIDSTFSKDQRPDLYKLAKDLANTEIEKGSGEYIPYWLVEEAILASTIDEETSFTDLLKKATIGGPLTGLGLANDWYDVKAKPQAARAKQYIKNALQDDNALRRIKEQTDEARMLERLKYNLGSNTQRR